MYARIHATEQDSAEEKNEALSSARTQKDLEGILLSDTSRTGKDKHCTIPLTGES